MSEYTDADENAVLLTEIGVGAVGLASLAVTTPSGAEAAFAIVAVGFSAFNVRPGSPFHRVAFACEEIEKRLEDLEKGGGDFEGIEPFRKKIADAWKGPGAEAFDAYVDGNGSGDLVGGIGALRAACKDAAPVYKDLGEALDGGVEAYFVLAIANTIAQIALNLILAKTVGTTAPWIIAAKFAVAIVIILSIVGMLKDIFDALSNDVNTAGGIAVATDRLRTALSDKSEEIESNALALSKEKVDSVENPNDWEKE